MRPQPASVPTPLRGEFQMLTPTQTQQKYAYVASQGLWFQLEGSEITPGRVRAGASINHLLYYSLCSPSPRDMLPV
jgi:hypothetical protein